MNKLFNMVISTCWHNLQIMIFVLIFTLEIVRFVVVCDFELIFSKQIVGTYVYTQFDGTVRFSAIFLQKLIYL